MSEKVLFNLPCKLSYPDKACDDAQFLGDYEVKVNQEGTAEMIIHSRIINNSEPRREIKSYSRA